MIGQGQMLEALITMTANEEKGVTMAEAWMYATFKDGAGLFEKWEGDQIVYERFYYNIPGQ